MAGIYLCSKALRLRTCERREGWRQQSTVANGQSRSSARGNFPTHAATLVHSATGIAPNRAIPVAVQRALKGPRPESGGIYPQPRSRQRHRPGGRCVRIPARGDFQVDLSQIRHGRLEGLAALRPRNRARSANLLLRPALKELIGDSRGSKRRSADEISTWKSGSPTNRHNRKFPPGQVPGENWNKVDR